MKTLFLFLSLLLCLAQSQSFGQRPGTVQWSLLINPDSNPNSTDTIRSIRMQADGKIVAAGNTYNGGVIAIGRFDGAGRADSAFGNNGIVLTRLDSAYIGANAMELQPDGKIIVAGGYRKGADQNFLLARYQPDGRLDSSFGTNGMVRTAIGFNTADVATALAIQPDGKIIAAGKTDLFLALCRYKPNGTLDSSFDSDGRLAGAVAGATCMKLQANGKILVGCDDVVTRLNPDGSPDNRFGSNALVSLAGFARAMTLQNDGKILIAGNPLAGRGYFVLERIDTTGAPDNSFGTGGVAVAGSFNPGASNPNSFATSVCLQRDGRILVGGWTQHCLLGDCRDFSVARWKSNGALDSSFGSNGLTSAYIPAFHTAQSYSATITLNNELVLAGANGEDIVGPSKWALVSFYLGPPLAIYTAAAGDGYLTVTPNPAENFARLQAANIENGAWQVSLCDLTGRILSSETVVVTDNTLKKSISLAGLPAAMYLLKFRNGAGETTLKLLKSR